MSLIDIVVGQFLAKNMSSIPLSRMHVVLFWLSDHGNYVLPFFFIFKNFSKKLIKTVTLNAGDAVPFLHTYIADGCFSSRTSTG
jgi:hypothetical protein